jgi:hypothetical protein
MLVLISLGALASTATVRENWTLGKTGQHEASKGQSNTTYWLQECVLGVILGTYDILFRDHGWIWAHWDQNWNPTIEGVFGMRFWETNAHDVENTLNNNFGDGPADSKSGVLFEVGGDGGQMHI